MPIQVFLALPSNLKAPPSSAPPDLQKLAEGAPNKQHLADLALALGCSFDLLLRVSAKRQPLPAWLVCPVARALGVQEGEVRAAAGRTYEGPRTAAAERALPPDRLLGEPLYPSPLSATVPPTFAGA